MTELLPTLLLLADGAAQPVRSGSISAGHFIYIPLTILIGVVLGFILGGRAARDALAAEQKKAEARAARKAARDQQG